MRGAGSPAPRAARAASSSMRAAASAVAASAWRSRAAAAIRLCGRRCASAPPRRRGPPAFLLVPPARRRGPARPAPSAGGRRPALVGRAGAGRRPRPARSAGQAGYSAARAAWARISEVPVISRGCFRPISCEQGRRHIRQPAVLQRGRAAAHAAAPAPGWWCARCAARRSPGRASVRSCRDRR